MERKDKIWMTDFVLAMNKGALDAPFIIATAPPHYVGKVLMFKTPTDFVVWINQYDGLAYAKVGDYRVVVAFWGTLAGSRVFIHPDVVAELDDLTKKMANFYLEHTIKEKTSFYNKNYRYE